MRGRSPHDKMSRDISDRSYSDEGIALGNPAQPQLEIVYFGGTILMAIDNKGGHKPFYTPLDIAYYQAISNSDLYPSLKNSLITGLLRNGAGENNSTYARIKSKIHPSKDINLEEYGKVLLKEFGFHPTYQKLTFNPIDSINFNAPDHLPSLLNEVKRVIERGRVPVILGGTDSLSKYGPLLHEELIRAGATTLPVLIVSSMCAFGDAGTENQDHVLALFKTAKIAAQQLVDSGKKGVYALVAENKEVTAASLISLASPVEKISGNIVKAFVGLDTTEVIMDQASLKEEAGFTHPSAAAATLSMEHFSLSNNMHSASSSSTSQAETEIPSFAGVSPVSTEPQSLRKTVMLPIEAFNNPRAITRMLTALDGQSEQPFDAIIIKGLPINNETVEEMATRIKSLTTKGTAVAFVDGFKYSNTSGKLKPILKEGELEAKADTLRTLTGAGAIFLQGISSTQAYIQASMGELPTVGITDIELPAHNPAAFATQGEQTAEQAARREDALAIEYFPNSLASQKTLTTLSERANMDIVLAGYTQGAIPLCGLPVGLKHKPTVTFHTAGKQVANSKVIETADTDGTYAAHEDIKDTTNTGGPRKPKTLLLPDTQVQGSTLIKGAALKVAVQQLKA